MDKSHVKSELIKLQEKVIADLEQASVRKQVAADIDEAETKDPEDFSHQEELNEMAKRMEIHMNNAKADLSYLQKLTDDKVDTVSEGALVETDRYHIYVGIAVNHFKVGDHTVVGISTEAPIYSAMEGKSAGDDFSFNDTKFQIKSIL